MTPIEIMALIVVVVAAIKILVILVNPKAWMGVVKKVYMNSAVTMVVSLILAALVLYYLLAEISIIQIFAVMLFIALLAAVSIAAYSKEMIDLASKMLKNRAILRRAWLPIIIWVVLLLWALKELFMV